MAGKVLKYCLGRIVLWGLTAEATEYAEFFVRISATKGRRKSPNLHALSVLCG